MIWFGLVQVLMGLSSASSFSSPSSFLVLQLSSSCRTRPLFRPTKFQEPLAAAPRFNGDLKSRRPVPPTDFSSCSVDKSTISSGQIAPMLWDEKQLSLNAFRVGLPTKLLGALRDYANRMGITDFYRGLLIEDQPYLPGQNAMVRFEGYNWLVQRPKSHWRSNMHWASPADEKAHDDYLRALSDGGFDHVLETIGTYFGLDGLSAYHLSFIGVSHCEKGFIHADVSDSGRKAFNLIIPLMLADETGPELEILSDDESSTRYYQYEYNVASMIGDDALHATAACDYRSRGVMRMAATVYVGDITPPKCREDPRIVDTGIPAGGRFGASTG